MHRQISTIIELHELQAGGVAGAAIERPAEGVAAYWLCQ